MRTSSFWPKGPFLPFPALPGAVRAEPFLLYNFWSLLESIFSNHPLGIVSRPENPEFSFAWLLPNCRFSFFHDGSIYHKSDPLNRPARLSKALTAYVLDAFSKLSFHSLYRNDRTLRLSSHTVLISTKALLYPFLHYIRKDSPRIAIWIILYAVIAWWSARKVMSTISLNSIPENPICFLSSLCAPFVFIILRESHQSKHIVFCCHYATRLTRII